MSKLKRLFRHLTSARWQITRLFSKRSFQAIEAAIAASEKTHMGELRFVVEAGLDLPQLLSGMNSRARALQVFSNLRIWDTEYNSGVLIYLLLAERKVEIICDRGINQRVPQTTWDNICKSMEHHFRQGEFELGAVEGIQSISLLLQQNFPARLDNHDELPNRPVII